MWTLPKPSLIDAYKDIPNIINASEELDETDTLLIRKLFKIYDDKQGSISQSDCNILSNIKQNALHDQYSKTQKGGALSYIRNELKKNVNHCPICGIGEPAQLDHVYPQSDFYALSVCRLNLVPECGPCNNHKSAKDPQKFLHPYYSSSTNNKKFFVIKINVKNKILSWTFDIDSSELTNTEIDKIKYQIKEVDLIPRLYRQTNSLLLNILARKENWNNIQALKFVFEQRYEETLLKRGTNDWQTVFFRGLLVAIDNKELTLDVANEYIKRVSWRYEY